MRIFNYHPTTGHYLGESTADRDRETPGGWLIPAFATTHEAPPAPAGRVAVFDRAADAWTVQTLPPEVPGEVVAGDPDAEARRVRAALLAASDWVVLRAYELSEPVPEAWGAYRQALRDVPAQGGYPTAINWPTAPGA